MSREKKTDTSSVPTSLRIKPSSDVLWKAISDRLGMSKVAVFEMLIHQRAAQMGMTAVRPATQDQSALGEREAQNHGEERIASADTTVMVLSPEQAKWLGDLAKLFDSMPTEIVSQVIPPWPSDRAEFHKGVVDRVARYLRVALTRYKSRKASYETIDSTTRLIVLVSKLYIRGSSRLYWFAFTPTHREFLEASPQGYVAFGCGSEEKIVFFTFSDFVPYLANMNKTEGSEKSGLHYHVLIHEGENGTLLIEQPLLSMGEKTDISAFVLDNGSEYRK